jgi:hypothetical protein
MQLMLNHEAMHILVHKHCVVVVCHHDSIGDNDVVPDCNLIAVIRRNKLLQPVQTSSGTASAV